MSRLMMANRFYTRLEGLGLPEWQRWVLEYAAARGWQIWEPHQVRHEPGDVDVRLLRGPHRLAILMKHAKTRLTDEQIREVQRCEPPRINARVLVVYSDRPWVDIQDVLR